MDLPVDRAELAIMPAEHAVVAYECATLVGMLLARVQFSVAPYAAIVARVGGADPHVAHASDRVEPRVAGCLRNR